MAFNPPPFPAADETYQYGNVIWRFDGTAGVWNIVDGSLVGEQGPPGPQGPAGPKGDQGDPGEPSVGDGAAMIVNDGVITARLGGFGITGVVGVTGRFGVSNGIVSLLPASAGASGIASFDSTYFSVSSTGHVNLTSVGGLVGATGDTVLPGIAIGVANEGGNVRRINNIGVTGIAVGDTEVGLTGRVQITAGTNVTITTSGNRITIGSSAVGGAGITANPQQVLFSSGNGGTGNNNFVFNGLAATFGGANTQFTITGPTFNIGNNTVVRGGIFYDAAESAPYTDFGTSQVAIKASNGSVQRVRINQTQTATYSVTFDESVPGNWTDTLGVAESVVVILQSANGKTGGFDSGILLPSTSTILGGVTGGIDVFTMMRIPHSGGSLKMAFPIARGMTAPNFSIGT